MSKKLYCGFTAEVQHLRDVLVADTHLLKYTDFACKYFNACQIWSDVILQDRHLFFVLMMELII